MYGCGRKEKLRKENPAVLLAYQVEERNESDNRTILLAPHFNGFLFSVYVFAFSDQSKLLYLTI